MTDERYVYKSDIQDRKRTASGARAKKGGSRSCRCPLPSDTLTKAQKRALNGSVESIKLNMPMDYARLKELTPTLQWLYLDHLVSEHKARRVDLCSMLGIATCTFWHIQRALPANLVWKYNKKKPAPEWERFMAAGYQNASTPPNFAHSATGGRDGAGHALCGVHACRAFWKRHGALYGLSRGRRAAAFDRRSEPRVYVYGQL